MATDSSYWCGNLQVPDNEHCSLSERFREHIEEAVSQVKSEAAFLLSTHVALLPNVHCHPERSEGTEAEGGKNNQSVFNAGPCPGSFATLRMTRVDGGCF